MRKQNKCTDPGNNLHDDPKETYSSLTEKDQGDAYYEDLNYERYIKNLNNPKRRIAGPSVGHGFESQREEYYDEESDSIYENMTVP